MPVHGVAVIVYILAKIAIWDNSVVVVKVAEAPNLIREIQF